MSMSMQDYIVRFGVEGLNNLDTAVLSMNKLGTVSKTTANTMSTSLGKAAKDANISFTNLSQVIGTKMVSSFALFQKGTQSAVGNVQRMQAAILQADGAVMKLNYNLERIKYNYEQWNWSFVKQNYEQNIRMGRFDSKSNIKS